MTRRQRLIHDGTKLQHIPCGVKVDFIDMDGLLLVNLALGTLRQFLKFSCPQDYAFYELKKKHTFNQVHPHKYNFRYRTLICIYISQSGLVRGTYLSQFVLRSPHHRQGIVTPEITISNSHAALCGSDAISFSDFALTNYAFPLCHL